VTHSTNLLAGDSVIRIDRQKQKKTTDFETLHRGHIDEWDLLQENIILSEEPHTDYSYHTNLAWYLGAMRTKLKGQWTQVDYGDIQSSDDEDTSHDLATRAGTLVEAAPILDRVVRSRSASLAFHMTRPRITFHEAVVNKNKFLILVRMATC